MLIQKHKCGIAKDGISGNPSFSDLRDSRIGYKNVFNVVQIVKIDVFEIIRLSNQTDVNFIFIQQIKRFVGRLTVDGNTDMRILPYEFFQIGQKHKFTECGTDTDLQVTDTKIDGAF